MRYITETRNLFDYSKVNGLMNIYGAAMNADLIKDGNKFTVKRPVSYAATYLKYIFHLNAGTYTLSLLAYGTVSGGTSGLFGLVKVEDDYKVKVYNKYKKFWESSNDRQFLTMNIEEDGNYAVYAYGLTGSVNLDCTFWDIQLELGDKATDYVPYGYLPMYKGKYKVSNVCQLLDKSKYYPTQTNSGITFTNNGDGTITVNGTATGNAQLMVSPLIHCKDNHKYLVKGSPSGGGYNLYRITTTVNEDGSYVTGFSDSGSGNISNALLGSYTISVFIDIYKGQTVSNLTFKPQLFDLTEMYGAGHEPTTVEQFRQDFPEEMYEYTPYCWASMKNIRYLDTTKNLFEWLGTSLHPDDYANAVLIEIVQNGIILQGNDSGISQPNHYNNGWFRPGANYGTIANKVKLTAGDTVTISADYLLIDGPYNNTNIGIYLYGAANSTALVRVSKGKLKRVSATYPVTVTGEYYPVFTLNSSKVQITNIQVELGDTATPYVPYGYLPLK